VVGIPASFCHMGTASALHKKRMNGAADAKHVAVLGMTFPGLMKGVILIIYG
jgi:hypothetical protein